MDPPVTRYVQRDGCALAYQVMGAGDTNILWHFEIGLHPDLMWTDPHIHYLFDRTAAQGRNVSMLRRGLGLSDPVDHIPTVDQQADDVLAVMDDAGMDTALLSGTGSGCGPLILAAARHPERVTALILNQPFVEGLVRTDDRTPTGWEGHDADAYVAGWRDVYTDWGAGRTLEMWDPSVDSPLNRRLMGLLERSTASPAAARTHLEWLLRVDCVDALAAVQCPTRILHPGTSSRPLSVSRELARIAPAGSAHVLAAALPGAALGEAWLPVVEHVEEALAGRGARPVDVDRFLGTVLFTDVVDSTSKLAVLGDHDYRDLRAAHERAVRVAVDRAGGRLVNVTGDGTFSVFDGPTEAVRCAVTVCRDARSLGLEIRAGVHTGPLERSAQDLTGMTVHTGARIGALAGPGEVLVSKTVRDLTSGAGLAYVDHGTHSLKGVPGRCPLFALADGTDTHRMPHRRPSLSAVDRAIVTAARRTPQVLRAAVRVAYARQKHHADTT